MAVLDIPTTHQGHCMKPATRVRCLLTFDYELYHGQNHGTADDVLFEPAARLLDLCDALGVRTTFFPDVCSVWWHREHSEEAFAARFEAQMRDVFRRGHDVQLHLHPHWLWCTRENGRFVFDARKVYLHELGWGDGAMEAPAVIRRGVEYLDSLLTGVSPGYRCTAFRAASLALQPQEHQLLGALHDAGIRLDTSVTRGVRTVSDTYTLDYRHVPSAPNWFMSAASGLEAAASGILEVPIGTFRAPLPQRLSFLWRRVMSIGEQRGGDPMSRTARQNRAASFWHLVRTNLRYLGGNPWFTMSCDTKGFNTDMLIAGLHSIIEAHQGQAEIAVAMINHPKLMAAPQRRIFQRFIERVRDRYGTDLEFTTTSETLQALTADRWPASRVAVS